MPEMHFRNEKMARVKPFKALRKISKNMIYLYGGYEKRNFYLMPGLLDLNDQDGTHYYRYVSLYDETVSSHPEPPGDEKMKPFIQAMTFKKMSNKQSRIIIPEPLMKFLDVGNGDYVKLIPDNDQIMVWRPDLCEEFIERSIENEELRKLYAEVEETTRFP
jgi:antitoxin component of MazEF toxin-antitoxin module